MPPQRARWQLAVKRLMDVVVSATLLVLLLPALLVIAVAVKVTSEAPWFIRGGSSVRMAGLS